MAHQAQAQLPESDGKLSGLGIQSETPKFDVGGKHDFQITGQKKLQFQKSPKNIQRQSPATLRVKTPKHWYDIGANGQVVNQRTTRFTFQGQPADMETLKRDSKSNYSKISATSVKFEPDSADRQRRVMKGGKKKMDNSQRAQIYFQNQKSGASNDYGLPQNTSEAFHNSGVLDRNGPRVTANMANIKKLISQGRFDLVRPGDGGGQFQNVLHLPEGTTVNRQNLQSPLTSVASSISKSQRITQGYIIGDNCYSPMTLKNESVSMKQDEMRQSPHRQKNIFLKINPEAKRQQKSETKANENRTPKKQEAFGQPNNSKTIFSKAESVNSQNTIRFENDLQSMMQLDQEITKNEEQASHPPKKSQFKVKLKFQTYDFENCFTQRENAPPPTSGERRQSPFSSSRITRLKQYQNSRQETSASRSTRRAGQPTDLGEQNLGSVQSSRQNSKRSPAREGSQQKKGIIIEELREIDHQVRHLQHVYTRNQEVMRQIKLKVKKKPERKKERSPDPDFLTSRYQPENTHSFHLFTERREDVQQEELYKALLQSQMKNLQIQQKLRQKSDLHLQLLDQIFKGSSIKGTLQGHLNSNQLAGHSKRTNTHHSSVSSNEKKGLARQSVESVPSEKKAVERKAAIPEAPPTTDIFKQTHLQASEQSFSKSDTLDSPNMREAPSDDNQILRQMLLTLNQQSEPLQPMSPGAGVSPISPSTQKGLLRLKQNDFPYKKKSSIDRAKVIKQSMAEKIQPQLVKNDDQFYLNQTWLTDRGLELDLYFKQKQRVDKEEYLEYIQARLEKQIKAIEKEYLSNKRRLIKEGMLQEDQLVENQEHIIRAKQDFLESESLPQTDLLQEMSTELKGLPLREREKLVKQRVETQHAKKLEIRERKIFNDVQSDHSNGSFLVSKRKFKEKAVEKRQIESRLSEDAAKATKKEEKKHVNVSPEKILTNESVRNILSQQLEDKRKSDSPSKQLSHRNTSQGPSLGPSLNPSHEGPKGSLQDKNAGDSCPPSLHPRRISPPSNNHLNSHSNESNSQRGAKPSFNNGYDLSVQKLAKVSGYGIDNDSILSTVRSVLQSTRNQNLPNPDYGSDQVDMSRQTKSKLHKPSRVPKLSGTMYELEEREGALPLSSDIFKSFSQARNTAPGGDREKLAHFRNESLQKVQQLSNVRMPMSSSIAKEETQMKNTSAEDSVKPSSIEEGRSVGLIDRSNLRFDNILKFKLKKVTKKDVANYEDNDRLKELRYRFQQNKKFFNRGSLTQPSANVRIEDDTLKDFSYDMSQIEGDLDKFDIDVKEHSVQQPILKQKPFIPPLLKKDTEFLNRSRLSSHNDQAVRQKIFNQQEDYSKTVYITHRSNRKSSQSQSRKQSARKSPRSFIPAKTHTIEFAKGKDPVMTSRKQVFDGSSFNPNTSEMPSRMPRQSMCQTWKGSTNQSKFPGESGVSSSVFRASSVPRNIPDKLYQEYISNKSSILPALKDQVGTRSKIEGKQLFDLNRFHMDLMLDRVNHTSEHIIGSAFSRKQTLDPSTIFAERQKLNDNSLLNGTNVQFSTKSYAPKKLSPQNKDPEVRGWKIIQVRDISNRDLPEKQHIEINELQTHPTLANKDSKVTKNAESGVQSSAHDSITGKPKGFKNLEASLIQKFMQDHLKAGGTATENRKLEQSKNALNNSSNQSATPTLNLQTDINTLPSVKPSLQVIHRDESEKKETHSGNFLIAMSPQQKQLYVQRIVVGNQNTEHHQQSIPTLSKIKLTKLTNESASMREMGLRVNQPSQLESKDHLTQA